MPLEFLSRIFRRILLVVSTLVGLSTPAQTDDRGGQKPNIVVFLTDDHSQRDSSAYGAPVVRTPHMDRVARAGMIFTNAYAASPTCAPSRAALLTGLMPARNGAEANHSKARQDVKSWPAYFAELGYDVAAFGKVAHYKHNAHYGFTNEGYEGFHKYEGIPAAAEFISKAGRSKPVCVLIGTNWPHVPWPEQPDGYGGAAVDIPRAHVDTPETRDFRARYYTAIAKADADLGLIYDAALKNLGANTVFVVSSDHGAQWPFGKWTCYEAGVKVPLLVTWPNVVHAGSSTDAMVSWVDLLPTLIEAAGGTPPRTGLQNGELDGRSFLPVLQGKSSTHRDRIFTTHSGDGRMNCYPIRALRIGDWKYIRNLHPEFQFTTHVDKARDVDGAHYWKSWERAAQNDPAAAAIVKRYGARPSEELYDLSRDPHELKNLAAEPAHADRLQSMRAALDAWMKEQGDKQTVFGPPTLLSN